MFGLFIFPKTIKYYFLAVDNIPKLGYTIVWKRSMVYVYKGKADSILFLRKCNAEISGKRGVTVANYLIHKFMLHLVFKSHDMVYNKTENWNKMYNQ